MSNMTVEDFIKANSNNGIFCWKIDDVSYLSRKLIPVDVLRKCLLNWKLEEWECRTDKDDIQNLQNYYEGKAINCELRWLGIIIACYDKDNFVLEYPIKITSKEMDYDDANPSKRDPNQGCK